MKTFTETAEDTLESRTSGPETLPGILVIFSGDRPALATLPFGDGPMVLGRDHTHPVLKADGRLSRQHVRIGYDGARWTIEDLGSRNGTFVDGAQIQGVVHATAPRVVRIGHTLLLPVVDLRRHVPDVAAGTLERSDGMVAGPTTRGALAAIRGAGAGETLLVLGESGTGKELAARAFHAAAVPAGAPLVSVNCAAIPSTVAERLLFGARKGAFSGATADVGGYVQAAEGGVLFLDEIGELDLEVQAKILRLIESREVVPLGAQTPRQVRVKICLATHRDLRGSVAAGRFRADLYYRIAEPHVALAPLRERAEEIPYLVTRELTRGDEPLKPDVRLVEACMVRPWPGNVRELIGAMARAAAQARAAGEAVVRPDHLAPQAGMAMEAAVAMAPFEQPARATDPVRRPSGEPRPASPGAARADHTRESIEVALRANGGNVAATARALALHRTQLYRLLKRFGLGGVDAEGGAEGDGEPEGE